jgi:hypothetical protein
MVSVVDHIPFYFNVSNLIEITSLDMKFDILNAPFFWDLDMLSAINTIYV